MGRDTIHKRCLCHYFFSLKPTLKKKKRKKETESLMKLGKRSKHKAKSILKGYPMQEN